MQGILKKKTGSKSGNKITFNKDVKDYDGLSAKNKSWFNFIDLVYNLYIEPQIAWERVPEKHKEYVWDMVVYVVNRFTTKGWAYSMPMGSRKKITMFILKSEDKTMQNLLYFIYDYYYERQLSIKNKRKKIIKYNEENEENNEWSKLKDMFCSEHYLRRTIHHTKN